MCQPPDSLFLKINGVHVILERGQFIQSALHRRGFKEPHPIANHLMLKDGRRTVQHNHIHRLLDSLRQSVSQSQVNKEILLPSDNDSDIHIAIRTRFITGLRSKKICQPDFRMLTAKFCEKRCQRLGYHIHNGIKRATAQTVKLSTSIERVRLQYFAFAPLSNCRAYCS